MKLGLRRRSGASPSIIDAVRDKKNRKNVLAPVIRLPK